MKIVYFWSTSIFRCWWKAGTDFG